MFNVGDKVVYPMHGAGTIEAIEDKDILGQKQSYYIIKMPGEVKVMVPTPFALVCTTSNTGLSTNQSRKTASGGPSPPPPPSAPKPAPPKLCWIKDANCVNWKDQLSIGELLYNLDKKLAV